MEIIGILGTLFIIFAFMQNNEVKIRVLDSIGAILFIIYGVSIGSLSTILLNGILIAIQLYKLAKIKDK